MMSTVHGEKKAASQDAAINMQESTSYTFEGKIISITNDQLLMTNEEGKEYAHTLVKDVEVTCDGKVSRASDLKAGMKVRITKNRQDQNLVSGIEALDQHAEFAER